METQTHPLLARYLRRLLEVLRIEQTNEIPSLLLLEQHVRLLLEGVELLQLGLGEAIIIAEQALPPMPALEMGFRLRGKEVGLCLHELNL